MFMVASEIISRLKKVYISNCFHRSDDPFYVLISTVLSHRTRDEITFPATDRLFAKYNTPQKLIDADPADIENLIKDVGFYHIKTGRIIEISKILIEEYDGNVPYDIDNLLKLPGVGRKTANCVLIYAFSQNDIAVDTHVHRISNRLGLVHTTTPYETEIELKKVIPYALWKNVNEFMVQFGQQVCRPVGPKCTICVLNDLCPSKTAKK